MACVCVGGGAREGGDGDKSQHPYILFFEMEDKAVTEDEQKCKLSCFLGGKNKTSSVICFRSVFLLQADKYLLCPEKVGEKNMQYAVFISQFNFADAF